MNAHSMQFASPRNVVGYVFAGPAHIGAYLVIASAVVLIVVTTVVWALEELREHLGAARPLFVFVTVCFAMLFVPIALQLISTMATGHASGPIS